MTFENLNKNIESYYIAKILKLTEKINYIVEDSNHILDLMGYKIIKTNHVKIIRDSDSQTRDSNIPAEEYKRIFTKFLAKVKNPINGKIYHILYKKNEMGKYNDIIIDTKGNKLVIVTIIQKFRQSAQNYISKPGDLRTIVEAMNQEFIFLI